MASLRRALIDDASTRIAIALVSALSLWLLAAAALLDLEYYDGIDAVSNARYFAGQGPAFISNRSPMMAWLLLPAESIHRALALHPLDFRPHHALMALLHVGYLAGTYALLARIAGGGWATLAAFTAAVPTFLFFTYAPFLSHDIAPGLALLAMVWLSERYAQAPRAAIWLALVALGAAAALVKPTYGLLWLGVLIGHALLGVAGGREGLRRSLAGWLGLAAGAAVSAAVYWLAVGAALASVMPDVPYLVRPLAQARFLVTEAADSTYFPPWVYLRNLPAFGFVTAVLIAPALFVAFTGARLARLMAIAWIVAVLAMHLIGLREVRYLAFLAPVSAYLLVAPLRAVLARPAGRIGVVVLLAANLLPVTPYSLAGEALLVAHPFYRESEARRLLEVIAPEHAAGQVLIVNWKSLSFAPPEPSPLAGDRFHRIFRLAPHHFGFLYGIDRAHLKLASIEHLSRRTDWPDAETLLLAFGPFIVNPVDWRGGEPHGRASTEHAGLSRRSVTFDRVGPDEWRAADGAVAWLSADAGGTAQIATGDDALAARLAPLQFLRARFGERGPLVGLVPTGPGRYGLAGGLAPGGTRRLEIVGYSVERVVSYRRAAPGDS